MVPPITQRNYWAYLGQLITVNPAQRQIGEALAIAETINNAPCTPLPACVYAILDGRKRNLGSFNLDGLDVVANYNRATGFGSIDLVVDAVYELGRKQRPLAGAPFVDFLAGNSSRFKLRASLGAQIGKLRAQATLHHTAGYRLVPPVGLAPQQTSVAAFDVVNLFLKYDGPGEGVLEDVVAHSERRQSVRSGSSGIPAEHSALAASGYANGQTLGRTGPVRCQQAILTAGEAGSPTQARRKSGLSARFAPVVLQPGPLSNARGAGRRAGRAPHGPNSTPRRWLPKRAWRGNSPAHRTFRPDNTASSASNTLAAAPSSASIGAANIAASIFMAMALADLRHLLVDPHPRDEHVGNVHVQTSGIAAETSGEVFPSRGQKRRLRSYRLPPTSMLKFDIHISGCPGNRLNPSCDGGVRFEFASGIMLGYGEAGPAERQARLDIQHVAVNRDRFLEPPDILEQQAEHAERTTDGWDGAG